MPDPRWEYLQRIFHAAVALPSHERSAYLTDACNGDLSMRAEVESLLKSHERTDNFVDTPAYQAAAEMLVEGLDLIAGSTVGHYRILSLLGEGGMGKVYLAEDTKLHRKVSLKFFPTNFAQDHERMRRFEQEARAISTFNHPNILTIHEISEADGHRFIVTELIEGQTLRERLQADLDIDEALDIAIQVASALVAAHRVNIVHRDIKPENIMIRKDDGLVKVLDFGLAKMTQGQRWLDLDSAADTALITNTAPGLVMGTAAYMSPEQARGDRVDERTDIWSLGAVLYEMVVGSSPFIATSSSEIISRILSKETAPRLSRYSPQAPERLEVIVEKTLAKNRDERYQTIKDLLIDLKRLKQSLETNAAIERGKSTDKSELATEAQQTGGSTQVPPGTRQTSSAEYIVGQVRSHQRGAIISLGVLLVVGAIALIYAWRLKEAPVTESEIKSLAVLPLKSVNTEENYLGLGIADAVILRISQTGKLVVRPTSAVRRYLSEDTDGLTAAKQLGVDSVLEGTVQSANDRLRVSVNLLRTSDGTSLWSDSFDLKRGDIFEIQDTISQQVASRLQLKLNAEQQARLGKRYTGNPEAYEYYVKGRINLERITTAIGDHEAIDAAITNFKKAVEVDSKYALAYAQLGYAYMWMANFTDPDNNMWVGLAQTKLSTAETLDPLLAEIHEARFEYYFSKYGNWDLVQAAREARQALALNPSAGHNSVGIIYDHLGLDEAAGLRECQRALEIDPTNTRLQARLVEAYELYGKFDEAIDAHHRFFGTPGPTVALMAKGRLDEAQPLLEEAVKKNSGDLRARGRLALLFALRGKLQEAEAAIPSILKEARNNRGYHHVTFDIACIYALAGKTDETVKWLRTTVDTGMANYPLFARDPNLNRIRKEPAFIQFMTELKTRWDGYQREFDNLN